MRHENYSLDANFECDHTADRGSHNKKMKCKGLSEGAVLATATLLSFGLLTTPAGDTNTLYIAQEQKLVVIRFGHLISREAEIWKSYITVDNAPLLNEFARSATVSVLRSERRWSQPPTCLNRPTLFSRDCQQLNKHMPTQQ